MKLYEVEDKDNNISFGVNKTFAAAYETKKRTEELSKCKFNFSLPEDLSFSIPDLRANSLITENRK